MLSRYFISLSKVVTNAFPVLLSNQQHFVVEGCTTSTAEHSQDINVTFVFLQTRFGGWIGVGRPDYTDQSNHQFHKNFEPLGNKQNTITFTTTRTKSAQTFLLFTTLDEKLCIVADKSMLLESREANHMPYGVSVSPTKERN